MFKNYHCLTRRSSAPESWMPFATDTLWGNPFTSNLKNKDSLKSTLRNFIAACNYAEADGNHRSSYIQDKGLLSIHRRYECIKIECMLAHDTKRLMYIVFYCQKIKCSLDWVQCRTRCFKNIIAVGSFFKYTSSHLILVCLIK